MNLDEMYRNDRPQIAWPYWFAAAACLLALTLAVLLG